MRVLLFVFTFIFCSSSHSADSFMLWFSITGGECEISIEEGYSYIIKNKDKKNNSFTYKESSYSFDKITGKVQWQDKNPVNEFSCNGGITSEELTKKLVMCAPAEYSKFTNGGNSFEEQRCKVDSGRKGVSFTASINTASASKKDAEYLGLMCKYVCMVE